MRVSLSALFALIPLAIAAGASKPPVPFRFEPRPDGQFSVVSDRASGLISADRVTLPRESGFRFENANLKATVRGESMQASHSNYFLGGETRTRVPHYGRVRVANAYPGIDILYYSSAAGELEYDFVAAPRADISRIALRLDSAARLDASGDLVTAGARHHRPRVFQGGRELASRYRLDGQLVRFEIDRYNPAEAITIDPVLTLSTYFGGGSTDELEAMALDASGAIYLTGTSSSRDFPTSKGISPAAGNAFVSKFTRNGDQIQLAWSTYFGGNGNDFPSAIAVDADGFVYVAGRTLSTNFPLKSEVQRDQPLWDGFVIKFKQPGDTTPLSIEWATYLGGRDEDRLMRLALDGHGGVIVAGYTFSSNFPMVKSLQAYSDGYDAFVTKLKQPSGSTGVTIEWSTLLGGTGYETLLGLALDNAGNVYVAGDTMSSGYPVKDSIVVRNYQDVFVTKLIPPVDDGPLTLGWSTLLGGNNSNWGQALAVDGCGAVYVAGRSLSLSYHTVNAYQKENKGGQDAFVTKLRADAEGKPVIEWSTYLGGDLQDQVNSIAVDGGGAVYIVGETSSKNFPLTSPLQDAIGGSGSTADAFLAKLNQPVEGSPNVSVEWSTFWGGAQRDYATSVLLDNLGNIFLTGITSSPDLKLQNSFQGSMANSNGMFAQLTDPTSEVTIDSEPSKLSFTVTDATCNTRTLTTPATVKWFPGRPYRIQFEPVQAGEAGELVYAGWEDEGATEAGRSVKAPDSGSANYKIKFAPPPAN